MDLFWKDVRHALRRLRRDIRFAAVVVVTLGVGIGLDTAVFSLVHSTLLEPLPYRAPDQLAMIWTDVPAEGIHDARSAYANIRDWRAQNQVFADLATYDPTSLTLTGGEWPEQTSAALVSANLFSVLGVAPAVGRPFSPEEEQGAEPVAVLSHDLWRRRFDASPDAIGGTVEVAGRRLRVVGVMPEGFAFPERSTQLWLPQTLFTDWQATAAQRGTGAWRVVGRLRGGVSLERAQEEMSEIATRLEEQYPNANAGLGVRVVSLYEHVTGHSFRLALWTLFGAVGLVLLMACANAAHLMLARGMDRGPELALRRALGASTPRLVREALTENVVIALASGIAGLLLAEGGLSVLVALAPAGLPRLDEVGIDGPVLAYAVLASVAAGMLVGVAPAFRAAGRRAPVVARAGRGATRWTGGQRARRLLIVFQLALAIILVFGSNLLVRSFVAASNVDTGYATENVLKANLAFESAEGRTAFYERVLREVEAIPGVRAASLIEDLFSSGAPNAAVALEGHAEVASVEAISVDAIAGDFLQTMDVPLREGRAFSDAEREQGAPVALINETMARRLWPGQSPVDRRFRLGGPGADAPWIEVVGVVADMRRQGVERAPIPQVLVPYAMAPSRSMNLLVRGDVPVAGLVPTIRERVADIDPMVPLYQVITVADALRRYLGQRRFETFLLGLFSVLALVLAAVGIYGLIAYSVARRSHEMGVRAALGARPAELVSMVLRQGVSLAVPGLVIGLLCALWLAGSVSALLFGVEPVDLTNILFTTGVLVCTVLVACLIPARRAAATDPMRVLDR